ncbi:molybdopterin molybdotransferase MoeA [Bacteroidota bacterium]
MISFQEARKKILGTIKIPETESIKLEESQGRVLAEDIKADRDYPPFNRSAMDGFALCYEDLHETGLNQFIIAGEVYAGDTYTNVIKKGECIRIMTGAPVPEGADTVIMVEDVQEENGQIIIDLREKPEQWINISRKGEDLNQGDIYIREGVTIDHMVSGAAAVTGKSHLSVYKRPTVAIISTGDEVMPVDQPVEFFQIRNSNAYNLNGLLSYLSITPIFNELVKDDKQQIEETLRKVINCDVVIISGGVSMGDADFVPEILENLGVKNIFHRSAIKPGKPIWFGLKSNNGAVFGLPGNPLSSQVGYKLFTEPWIMKSMGMTIPSPLRITFNNERIKKGNLDHFFPCYLNPDMTLELKPFNGSGDITSTISTDGIAHHPASKEKIQPGDIVDFYPWKYW